MLKQRVITALVLVAVLFAALAVDSRWPFALVTLLLLAAGAWEWGRLNQAPPALALTLGGALALAGLAALLGGWQQAAPPALWWSAAALWLAGGAVVLRRGPPAWPHLAAPARWAVGLVFLWAAWLALIHAREIGINFMLSMLCLVWAADIAAYFGGRTFGRHKLAPTISPGKSWEGVWSGMVGVLLLALLWTQLDQHFGFDGPSLYSRLEQALGWPLTIVALLALCGLSVVGDLLESLVKRAAGAKDSSQLLPGHGGVLDRVDALLPVMPVALALIGLGAAWSAR
jgi:phosphatidate cytidylyltransferase